MKKAFVLLVVMLLANGCAVGPNYKRPKVDVPGSFRGTTASELARTENTSPQTLPPETLSSRGAQPASNLANQTSLSSNQSFGDQKWWEVFQDPQLQELIRTALKQNYDVRIAATRILEAQAQLGITRADQLPTIGVGASAVNERVPKEQPVNQAFETNATSVGASFAWELDFWGKYRRSTEAARANLLATEWARRAVINTLVSNVAASYFQLRALDLQLEISQRTLASRKESLELARTLSDGGAGTLLDVRQAEQLVSVAAETIPDLERRIQQEENFISTLLGNNPGPIARGMKLTAQPDLPEVP
ncbi:MAG TPA: TolC family protein, partial [Candidatus Acidoferrum sp.]|nr:TolC family protein [Candidatus Acidoferrum sp.]